MTTGAAPAVPSDPVTRRELGILICLSLGTVLAIGVVAEAGTRWRWAQQEWNACYEGAPADGRPRPSCVTSMKNAEGPLVAMAYNACGYRSKAPCGPKPVGSRRIVVLGTSISEGFYVPYEEHFAGRLETDLTSRCGFPVEVQNTASLERKPSAQASLIPEILGLQPDVVIWVLAPFDLADFSPRAESPAAAQDAPPAPAQSKVSSTVVALKGRVRLISRESRALVVAQHFMLSSDASLYRAYMIGQDDDVLRVPLSPANRARYDLLESELREFTGRLRAANIPLIVGGVPNRIQAALVSNRVNLPDTDPAAFGRVLDSMATRDGFLNADITSELARSPHAERLYYAVDGHPTAGANERIADALERTLVKHVPAFSACGSP